MVVFAEWAQQSMHQSGAMTAAQVYNTIHTALSMQQNGASEVLCTLNKDICSVQRNYKPS